MPQEYAKILSHFSNSGIVQMPGRHFPGIVMQGDSLSSLHRHLVNALADAKQRRDEEAYFTFFEFAQTLEGQLQHYEDVLKRLGTRIPYPDSIATRLVEDTWDE